MKLLTLIALFICFSINLSAATITAIANGNWNSDNTWNLDRVPQNNDVVIIPAGRTVFFRNSPYPKNNINARPVLNIQISGILDFSDAGTDKLYVDFGSTIQIYTGGKIQTSNNSSEIIAIYNGDDDNTVWTGTPAVLNGPKSATATTIGFSNALLPVTLVYFRLDPINDSEVKLSWQTSEEINSANFEPQRLDVLSNKWITLATIPAAGNSDYSITYSFNARLVPGVNQFRLKQEDIDGKLSFSSIRVYQPVYDRIKVFHAIGSSSIQVLNNSLVEQRGLSLSVYDVNGKKLLEERLTRSAQNIPIPATSKGVLIAIIRNGKHTLLAQKMIF